MVAEDTLKHALAYLQYFQEQAVFAHDMMTERGKHALRTSRNGDLRLRLGNFFQRAFLTLLISLLLVHSSLLNLFMNLSFDLISFPSLASLCITATHCLLYSLATPVFSAPPVLVLSFLCPFFHLLPSLQCIYAPFRISLVCL